MCDNYQKVDDTESTGASTKNCLGLGVRLFIADDKLKGVGWSGELMTGK